MQRQQRNKPENLPVPQVRRWTNHVDKCRSSYFRPGTEPQWYLDTEKYLEDRVTLISEPRLVSEVRTATKVTKTFATDVFTKPRHIDTTPVYEYSGKSTQSSKVCKCFGGPLNGQYITIAEARDADYIQFNMGKRMVRSNKGYHNAILIYLPEVTIQR